MRTVKNPWILGVAAAVWLLAHAAVLALAPGPLPFDGGPAVTAADALLAADVAAAEVGLLMVVVHLLTRRRGIPEMGPPRSIARRETIRLLGYGLAAQIVGVILGVAMGWHPIGFHLAGTLFGTHSPVSAGEALGWAAYNFTTFAVIPFFWLRKRYSPGEMLLRSLDRRRDLILILVVLVLEASFVLGALSSAILELSGGQLALGIPLTFALYFVGSVLPTLIFLQSALVPRFRRLTGSMPVTVLLGGVAYAWLHLLDGWTHFTSPRQATLSVLLVFFVYTAPGAFKTYLTLRTGNAWVHVWAYHAVTPHVAIDTPLLVKVFKV